jgi:hypothetical protein
MEVVHAILSIGGPFVTLAGVAVSVIGTYLLTKWYHPYTEEGFVTHLYDAPLLAMLILEKTPPSIPGEGNQSERREHKRVLQKLNKIAELAEVNKERRSVSLVGIDLIFIGFVLQGIGASFSLIDVAWTQIVALTLH